MVVVSEVSQLAYCFPSLGDGFPLPVPGPFEPFSSIVLYSPDCLPKIFD